MKKGIIYCIRNLVNGKCYIGKTIEPERRKKTHFQGRSTCPALQNALHKYGLDNFIWEVLHQNIPEPCLNAFEILAIAKYNTFSPNGYNLKGGGDGGKISDETKAKISESNSGKKRSEESRKQMSESQRKRFSTEEGRLKHSEASKGKKYSPDFGEKMSKIVKGRKHSEESKRKISEVKRSKNYKHSPETRAKMRKAWAERKKNPKQLLLIID